MGPTGKIEEYIRQSAALDSRLLRAPDDRVSGGGGGGGSGRHVGSSQGEGAARQFTSEDMAHARRLITESLGEISHIPKPLPITPAVASVLSAVNKPRSVDFGATELVDLRGARLEVIVSQLLGKLKEECDLYLLVWKGSKVPRGASIEGREIGWTQHQIVKDSLGEDIGFYDRLVEFGGPDKNIQVMIVHANRESLRLPGPPKFDALPVGTVRINTLDELCSQQGAIVATTKFLDRSKIDWDYFVVPKGASEMVARMSSYAGHPSLSVALVNYDCLWTINERAFLGGVFRTITQEEIEKVKSMPRWTTGYKVQEGYVER